MYDISSKHKCGTWPRYLTLISGALVTLCIGVTAHADDPPPKDTYVPLSVHEAREDDAAPVDLAAMRVSDPLEQAPAPILPTAIDRTLSVSDKSLDIDLEDRDGQKPESDSGGRNLIAPLGVPNLMPIGPSRGVGGSNLWLQTTQSFPRTSAYRNLGEYDWKLTRRVLMEEGAAPAHDAEGREICAVRFFPHDIFLPDEPFPLFLNKLHATTAKDPLVARTPIQAGDSYSALRQEDAREQLWNPDVFSSVVVVPVERPEETCVDVYVITRDLWSLRVGIQPQISGGTLENLELSIVESNFLGLNDTIGVGFAMDQGSWEIGPVWKPTWVFGANLDIVDNFRLIFDREFGGYDGVRNALRMERPLRSSWDNDAWYVDSNIRSAHARVFDGRNINTVRYTDDSTGDHYDVDERWKEVRFQFDGGYVRAWGLRYKTTLTVGAFVDLRTGTPAPMDDRVPDAVLEEFQRDRMPRSERAIGPKLQWEFYSNAYMHLTNYARFEVSESYKKGVHLIARLRYSDTAFGANVRFVDGTIGARYLAPLGDDAFIELATMGSVRWGANGFVDRRLEMSGRFVLPSGHLGRFVGRGWVRLLRDDDGNNRFRIGAAQGLRGERGYVAEGRNAWLANLEWRSKPVEVLSTYLGFAAFVDLGSAWARNAPIGTHASVGVGLRFMAPQAMAMPASIDVSWPVGQQEWTQRLPAPTISLQFGHIFEPTSSFDLDEFYR